jgi:hypothetical protein
MKCIYKNKGEMDNRPNPPVNIYVDKKELRLFKLGRDMFVNLF